MLIKLADLHWRQRRDRLPYLVGRVAGYDLLIVGRHNPAPGDSDFVLFVGKLPNTLGSKPLPPVWDPERTRWTGPAEPDYPEFYDDTEEAVADLKGR
jgi:hypothetical protein